MSNGSVAWRQPGNNRHILELQGAPSVQPGPIRIDYFGHCALRVTAPSGLSLLFDPWRNDPSGAWGPWFSRPFPRIVVDVALSTHAHFDHDALDAIDATMILDRMVGRWSFHDVTVIGIADKHATECPGWFKWIDAVKERGVDPYPPNNPGHLDMVSYVVETGGLRILIWGDNRPNPPAEVWSAWDEIDVLTLPIDGSLHCLSDAQADMIIARLRPKIVIPTHYRAPGTTTILSTLETAEAWVDAQPTVRRLATAALHLEPEVVKSLDRQIAYFAAHVDLG